MVLNRSAIEHVQDFEKELVPVPEWHGDIYIRSMTSRHSDAMQIWFLRLGDGETQSLLRHNPEALRDMHATLVSYCLCDDTGVLLFDDEEGREILRNKSGAVIERLAAVALRVNKLSGEAIEAEKKDFSTPVTASALPSAVPWDGVSLNSTSG